MDYKKIGFKAGLEIHQQLNTGKLFCSCPGKLRKDKPDFIVKRNLRALAGESGEIDLAAKHAQQKGLSYIYEGYNDTTCLVELDEEPPHLVNSEALKTAIVVALMLNCNFPSYIQVMRKTVVDGSNTSGFQRTMLIGTSGFIEVDDNKIEIESVCLEEDAARRTAEDKKTVTYRLDRLGIPLIEIATGPDIQTPEQAYKVAKKLGMLLRSTGKAMRGIGTIRQDVNVSIKGHPRIELKGFQDLKSMPKTIEKEVLRQQKEIKTKRKLEAHVRNVKPDCSSKFLRPMPGAARMYPETDHPFIPLTSSLLSAAKKEIPEDPEKKLKKYEKLTNSDYASIILFSEHEQLFNYLVKTYPKIKPLFIAETIYATTKEAIKKSKQLAGHFSNQQLIEVFKLLNLKKITKESVIDILVSVAKGRTVSDAAAKFKPVSSGDLEQLIKEVIKKNKSAPEHKLQGIVIGSLKSKAPVHEIIKTFKKLQK